MLGNVASSLGAQQEAFDSYERALRVFERIYGESHPQTAAVLVDEANVLVELGRGDDAIDRSTRAIAIFEATLGPRHSYAITARSSLAQTLVSLGRIDEAIARATATAADARSIAGAHARNDHMLAEALALLGEALAEKGDIAGARKALEEALRIDETLLGRDHPDLANGLLILGRAELQRGSPRVALPLLERAEHLVAKNDSDPALIAEIRLRLAQTLLLHGPHDARALGLLDEAQRAAKGDTRKARALRREIDSELRKAR
jgi:tetratricopeptide (TPR) repeat protein